MASSLSILQAARGQSSWGIDVDGGGDCLARHAKRPCLMGAGPADARAFLGHPQWLWDDLTPQDRAHVAARFQRGSLYVYGHFSGLDMYLLKLHELFQVVRKHMPVPETSRVHNLHACDIGLGPGAPPWRHVGQVAGRRTSTSLEGA